MIRLSICLLLFAANSVFAQNDVPTPPQETDSVQRHDADSVFIFSDTTALREQVPAISVTDSLLHLIEPTSVPDRRHVDLPQFSYLFDYDPNLARLAQAPWGEPESVFPFGLPASCLGRADDLFGDAAFANPVPLPASEYFLRDPSSTEYYLLTPLLSGLLNPLGRPITIYQPAPRFEGDTARSKVYVARGRGGFSNTSVTFGNRFGSLGSLSFDGNFIKYDGLRTFISSKVNRMRFIVSPNIDSRVRSRFAFFFNRYDSYEIFFPPDYNFKGLISDNYSGAAAQVELQASDRTSYGIDLSYRNDDQSFTQSNLRNQQRFQAVNAELYHRRGVGHHSLELSGLCEYLKYRVGEDAQNTGYYSISARDLVTLTEQLSMIGNISLTGGQDLTDRVSALTVLHYAPGPALGLSLLAGRTTLIPQPEQKYLPSVIGNLGFADPNYRITGSSGLDAGRADGVETIVTAKAHDMIVRLRAGAASMIDLPIWEVASGDYAYGDYTATAVDRKLVYASASVEWALPYNFYITGNYGYRQFYQDSIDYSCGPQHLTSGLAGTSFLIPKLLLRISGSWGVKYRSRSVDYLAGSADDSQVLMESFVGVDLKSFHFYYNFNNVLNSEYYVNGLLQPGRSHWWGFSWAFLD